MDKRFKAHVTALAKDGAHTLAVETATRYALFTSQASPLLDKSPPRQHLGYVLGVTPGSEGWEVMPEAGRVQFVIELVITCAQLKEASVAMLAPLVKLHSRSR